MRVSDHDCRRRGVKQTQANRHRQAYCGWSGGDGGVLVEDRYCVCMLLHALYFGTESSQRSVELI